MLNSQVHRNGWLVLGAAVVFTLVGCSKTATEESSSAAKNPVTGTPAAAAQPVAVAKAQTPPTMVTVPKGTAINAAVAQTLATDKNKVGDTFAASLTTPIQIDGKTVIPKGAHVTGRVVTVKKHELKVTLASVRIRGKSYALETNSVAGSKSKDKNQTKDTSRANKDVTLLTSHSKLTFKLAKAVTIPVKG